MRDAGVLSGVAHAAGVVRGSVVPNEQLRHLRAHGSQALHRSEDVVGAARLAHGADQLARSDVERTEQSAWRVAAADQHGRGAPPLATRGAQRRELAQRRLVGHADLGALRAHRHGLRDHAPLF